MFQEVLNTLFGIAALVAILDYFGVKPKRRTEGAKMTLNRAWKLAIMLILVTASLSLSGYSFYRSRHPKIIEKVIEKPVDRVIEKQVPVPVPCPQKEKSIVSRSEQHRAAAGAPPPQTVINSPNGIGISGGDVTNPTVNNYRNPLPEISVSDPSPIATDSPPPDRRRFPANANVLYRPGVSVIITMKGPFYSPAFIADCSVPCEFVSLWTVRDGVESSIGGMGGDFKGIGTKDHMGAGVVYAKPLMAGERVRLVFESLDDRAVTVTNVRPYSF